MRGHAQPLDSPLLPFTGSTDSTRLASQMAAERAGQTAQTMRGLVLAYIVGHEGATDKEISAGLGMDGSTARPRRIELRDAGIIKDAGFKRAGATVWVKA